MTACAHVDHDAHGTWLVIATGSGATVRYALTDLLFAGADADPDAYRVARGALLRGIRDGHGDDAAWRAGDALAEFERERGPA